MTSNKKLSEMEYVSMIKNDHRYLPLIAMKRGARKMKSISVTHRARQFGKSNYSIVRKVLLGILEVLLFFSRYSRGYYDRKDMT